MVDATRSEGEPSDNVCETAVVPASFKSDAWRHFGFAVSRNDKGEKVTGRQKTMCMTDDGQGGPRCAVLCCAVM